MGLLAWIRARFQMAPINRVAAVACHDQSLMLHWAGGTTASVDWNAINRVEIQTTDAGPFDDDVFFILHTHTKSYVIPQTSAGSGELLNRLQQLPGFNNEAVIESMGCTDNQLFLCWDSESLQEHDAV